MRVHFTTPLSVDVGVAGVSGVAISAASLIGAAFFFAVVVFFFVAMGWIKKKSWGETAGRGSDPAGPLVGSALDVGVESDGHGLPVDRGGGRDVAAGRGDDEGLAARRGAGRVQVDRDDEFSVFDFSVHGFLSVLV